MTKISYVQFFFSLPAFQAKKVGYLNCKQLNPTGKLYDKQG